MDTKTVVIPYGAVFTVRSDGKIEVATRDILEPFWPKWSTAPLYRRPQPKAMGEK